MIQFNKYPTNVKTYSEMIIYYFEFRIQIQKKSFSIGYYCGLMQVPKKNINLFIN